MMPPDDNLHDLERYRREKEDLQRRLRGGGGGNTSGPMDPRIDAIERRMEGVELSLKEASTALNNLRVDIAGMNGRLEKFATAESLGHVQGRVDRLPTVASLSAVVATAVGLIALMPKIQHWILQVWPN